MTNIIKPVCVFIGPVTSRSGYGDHCRGIVNSLLTYNKFDVKIVPTRWGGTPMTALDGPEPINAEIKQRILTEPLKSQPELQIQVTIPNEFQPQAKFNIGITAGIETTLPKAEWIEGLNRMDFTIVPSNFSREVLEKAGFTKTNPDGRQEPVRSVKPIDVVFEGVDTNVYKKTDEPSTEIDVTLNSIPESFNYLFVGHWLQGDIGADRKDIGMLVKVFCEVFRGKKNKPALILKTSGATFSKMDKDEILKKINVIRNSIGDVDLPNVYLLHGDLTPTEMNRLYNHPKVKVHVSLTHGEGFCVPRDTEIVTDSGLKYIQDFIGGEKVVTHTGKLKTVVRPLNRYYSGEMICVKAFNSCDPISFTPNHNIYTFDGGNFSWKSADKLELSDYVVYPINKTGNINEIKISDYISDPNIKVVGDRLDYIHSDKTGSGILNVLSLTGDVGKLFGYFIAEGNLGGRNGITFSFNKTERDTHVAEVVRIFKSTFGIEYSSLIENDRGSIGVRMYSTIINRLFDSLFGRGASNKQIPNIFLSANSEFKRGLLSGIFFGDGYITNKEVDLSVVSETLIQSVRKLLMEFGIVACWDNNNGELRKSNGKIQHRHVIHRLRITQKDSINKIHAIFTDNGRISDFTTIPVVYPSNVKLKSFFKTIDGVDYYITKIKELVRGNIQDTVYNLEVQGDESYLTKNFVVHNCRPALEATLSGKPLLITNWSGYLDFLPADLANLLPGEVKPVASSAVNEWIVKESGWFVANYSAVAQKLEDTFNNYLSYIPKAEKLRVHNAEKFTQENEAKLFIEILEKRLPKFEQRIVPVLPSFKKVGGTAPILPAFKKVGPTT